VRRILAGTDTEYGLLIEGRDAKTQVEDSQAFVRNSPHKGFLHWDYRFENPRNDLRGFQLKNLAVDPNDAKYDIGKNYASSIEIRSDRVLTNGARLYNDHGHPEYATPESFSIFELARFDQSGEAIVLDCRKDETTKLYKNNTDFHGASYGTHESYLVPRNYSFDALYSAVTPMLIVRQILTGAGKVGAESGERCDFQLSQRADFFVETANAETLWRRPIFNTRDEPHADPARWIRLHVISGDANMNPVCTAMRVGLVKLALYLLDAGVSPNWRLVDPVRTFVSISRDTSYEFRIPLEQGSWTTAYEIFESYFSAYEAAALSEAEMDWVVSQGRLLLSQLKSDFDSFRKRVDWAAKKHLLSQIGLDWQDSAMLAYDLEYTNIDPDEGLYHALVDAGEIDESLPDAHTPHSRALPRGIAVHRFSEHLTRVGWRGLTFGEEFIELPPDKAYPESLNDIVDVETFVKALRNLA
jgi:Pup amidohydrolase